MVEMGSIPVGELGRRWGRLEKEVKNRYNHVARKDRETYKKKMETYKPSPLFLLKKAAKEKPEAAGGSVDEYLQFFSTHRRAVCSTHHGLSCHLFMYRTWCGSSGWWVLSGGGWRGEWAEGSQRR